MKKLNAISLIATVLLLFGCAKEAAIEDHTAVVLDPATLYLERVTTPVLFASLEIHESGTEVSGWLLDRQGALRTFANERVVTLDLSSPNISGRELERLYLESEAIGEIEKQVLVDHYRKAVMLRPATEEIQLREDTEANQAYLTFQHGGVVVEASNTISCGSGTRNDYSQVVLQATGKVSMVHPHRDVQDLVNWLGTMEPESIEETH